MKKIEIKQICEELKQELKEEVQKLPALRIASLSIGKDYAASVYASAQRKVAKELGIDYYSIELEDNCSLNDLLGKIDELNEDKGINGIIVNKPFPKKVKEEVIFSAIDKEKDVEGMNPCNLGNLFYTKPLFASPTVLSVLKILKSLEIDLYGKEVVIIGFSTLGLILSVAETVYTKLLATLVLHSLSSVFWLIDKTFVFFLQSVNF